MKGTRTEPQCGFSHRVLTLLNEARVDYEVGSMPGTGFAFSLLVASPQANSTATVRAAKVVCVWPPGCSSLDCVVHSLLQVVNVLDEVHNPGLRETIKTFSQWPTIPQAGSTALPCTLMAQSYACSTQPVESLITLLNDACLSVPYCCLQLYVSGELVGGADIVTEMAEKGELTPLLRGQ